MPSHCPHSPIPPTPSFFRNSKRRRCWGAVAPSRSSVVYPCPEPCTCIGTKKVLQIYYGPAQIFLEEITKKWGNSHVANEQPAIPEIHMKSNITGDSSAVLQTMSQPKAVQSPPSTNTSQKHVMHLPEQSFYSAFFVVWREKFTEVLLLFIFHLSQNKNLITVNTAQIFNDKWGSTSQGLQSSQQAKKERLRNKSMETYGWSSCEGSNLAPLS